jgi:hypothetical protein
MENRKRKIKVKFEFFENCFEFLPTICYYKQSFRERFGKGAIIIAWLKFGISFYVEYMTAEEYYKKTYNIK